MKKLALSFLALGFWLLAVPVAAFAQTATLSLDPANGTFNQGCGFSLKVNLDTGGAQTDGTDAILIYDASRFNATSITNGTIYAEYPGNNIDSQAGKITISGLASVSTPFSGTGTLATVNLTVQSSAPAGATQVSFDFDPNNKAKTTDSNVVQRNTLVDVLNSVVNGSYIIGTGSCGVQASPSPSPVAGSGAGSGTGAGGSQTIVTQTQGSTGGTVVGTTPSAQYKTLPQKTLPPAGSQELTFAMAIFGGILTVLGVLGLALL